MSPATSAQVRRRQAARRKALARQQELNEERRRRDEHELEIAAEFAVLLEECDAARAAQSNAEKEMGRLVDTLIGDLRIRYHRASQLLVTSEEELKRLRQVAADLTTAQPDSELGRRAATSRTSGQPVANRAPHQGQSGTGTRTAPTPSVPPRETS
jgi:hypothetical protein